jgi:hypothetical protein
MRTLIWDVFAVVGVATLGAVAFAAAIAYVMRERPARPPAPGDVTVRRPDGRVVALHALPGQRVRIAGDQPRGAA